MTTTRRPEWHCAFCNYGEYVVEGDWVRAMRRREDHELTCNERPLDAPVSDTPARPHMFAFSCMCDYCVDVKKAMERLCDHPTPTQPFGDDLMDEAWRLTNGDRAAAYGDAHQVFTAYGWVWSAIIASKLRPGVFIDAADATLMMAGLKMCREANKVKRDNVVDAHGYLSLHSRVTELLAAPQVRETTDGAIVHEWKCGCATSPEDITWQRQCPKHFRAVGIPDTPVPKPVPYQRIEWECGCVTTGTPKDHDWNPSDCFGSTHGGGGSLEHRCKQSPLNHSAYQS